MNTQDLIEKLRRFPLVVGSVAVLLGCFFAYYFRMDMVTVLQQQHDEVSGRLMQVEDNLVAGASLDDHLDIIRKKIAELEKRIIRQSELAVNLKYFYQIESVTGVGLADLRQSSVKANQGGAAMFSNVGYNIILTGNFRQIIAYFDELENGSRFYRLSNFNLQRGREVGSQSVTLALNLDLLGWP